MIVSTQGLTGIHMLPWHSIIWSKTGGHYRPNHMLTTWSVFCPSLRKSASCSDEREITPWRRVRKGRAVCTLRLSTFENSFPRLRRGGGVLPSNQLTCGGRRCCAKLCCVIAFTSLIKSGIREAEWMLILLWGGQPVWTAVVLTPPLPYSVFQRWPWSLPSRRPTCPCSCPWWRQPSSPRCCSPCPESWSVSNLPPLPPTCCIVWEEVGTQYTVPRRQHVDSL